MTPLERAARALFDLDQKQAGSVPAKWGEQVEAFREHKQNQVRAVLTAIRELDETVLKAMRDTVPVDGYEWEYRNEEAVAHWQAMIDAMLAEEG